MIIYLFFVALGCLYLPSSSLYWASRLRLLLLSWECLSSSSSSSTSCCCCNAVIRSWSRLKASILATDSSRSRAHTFDSASSAAHRASLSLQRASTDACWELNDACSTCEFRICVCFFRSNTEQPYHQWSSSGYKEIYIKVWSDSNPTLIKEIINTKYLSIKHPDPPQWKPRFLT